MRNFYCLLILVVSSLNAAGQSSEKSIIGNWKMQSVDMGIYYNCQSDSLTIPDTFSQSLKGSQDSAFTVGLLAGMIKSFRIYHFIFNTDGTFKEMKDGKLVQEGTFVEDKGQHIITQKMKKAKQILNYKFEDKNLLLSVKEGDMEIKFKLAKDN